MEVLQVYHVSAFGIVLLFVYHVLSRLIQQFKQARHAANLGCKPVKLEATKWPFGIDVVMAMAKASKEGRMPDFIVDRYNAMGPRYTWRTRMLGSEYFTTAEPRNIQAILATQFNDFRMGVARRTNLNPVLGGSVFALDGAAWHSAREVIRPIFSREQVSDLSLLEHHFQTMLQCMPLDSRGWTNVVSLNNLFPSLTLDAATELFLGRSTDTLKKKAAKASGKHEDDADHGVKDFEWAFDRTQELLVTRLRLRSFYWVYGTQELKDCVAILHKLCDDAMAEAAQCKKENPDVKRYDFLDAMIARSENHSAVRDHVLGLLAAGRDTTAALTSWVFYCLIRNPKVFAKLRGIIMETFGPYHEEQTTITFSALKGCTYLQQVMNETLRLHSVVPFNSRQAVRDTTLPVGGGEDGLAPVFIPKGAEVNFSSHVLHRRHDIWGQDADEFVPERWEKRRPGWSYVPFNGGPRVCIGQQYALTEAGYLIVRMLQRFDTIQGIDVDPTRDWHNFNLVCSPGPGHDSVKVNLHAS
ncbi:cytochrome P450-17 [Coleophoma crateriformis]|uniref:Cytochrome P450-17 n=1 Tax=Coleophoma crateriformis TaxID=565419 RepID=A0A3D8R3J0_9HELO|nr:cytochrome P450-17 [Coleophoma crateriformis]